MMTPERYQRINDIFDGAADLDTAAREAFLLEKCGDDLELLRTVRTLLESDSSASLLPEGTTPVAGSSADRKEPDWTGKTVSHYEVLAKIGTGGMGVVFRARDTRLDRKVALKVLVSDTAVDPRQRRRFLREARVASALNHPNIIQIYDVDEHEGIDFIVMELVAGKTLDELVPSQGLRPNTALKYGVQIADALAAAHRAGLMHRDLKPGNVMVDDEGRVKVLDFGLAKRVEVDKPLLAADPSVITMKGTILGTAAYMSPEQAEGRAVDTLSDIFSFGVVLYEMLSGLSPFRRGSVISTLSAVIREEPEPLTGKASEFDQIVRRCLRKNPALRFQTATDLKAALLDAGDQSEPGQLTSTHRAAQRSRPWFASIALAAVLVAAAGIFLFNWQPEPESQATLIAQPLTTYPGWETDPTLSPDGGRVAFSWQKPDRSRHIYVKLIGSESVQRLANSPSGDFAPAWSPDGTQIAFLRGATDDATQLMLVPAIGGSLRTVAQWPTKISVNSWLAPYIAWSPDGDWLVVSAPQPERVAAEAYQSVLYAVPVDGGEMHVLTSPPPRPEGGDGSVAFSPDGDRLAFVRAYAADYSALHILELSPGVVPRGSSRELDLDARWVGSPSWTPDGKEIILSYGRTADRQRLGRLQVDTAHELRPIPVSGDNVMAVALSRDGKRLAYFKQRWDIDIWRVEFPGTQQQTIHPYQEINSTLRDQAPRFSPDGKRVMFISRRTGTPEIWATTTNGPDLIPLTSLRARATGAARWSPDGRTIVFVSDVEGERKLFTVSSVGGTPQRLRAVSVRDTFPSWSHDGKYIYLTSRRTNVAQVWKMAAAGGEPRQVTRGGGQLALESPDGKNLYYKKGSAVWRVPVEGGEEVEMIESVSRDCFAVTERGVYFIPNRDSEDRFSIQLYEFESGQTKLITYLPGMTRWGLSVAPDEQSILYSQERDEGADLMLVDNFR